MRKKFYIHALKNCNYGEWLFNLQSLANYIRSVTKHMAERIDHHEHIHREWWFFVESNSPSVQFNS